MIKLFEKLKNWKPIHLCWLYKRMGWKIPKYLIGVSSSSSSSSCSSSSCSSSCSSDPGDFTQDFPAGGGVQEFPITIDI